MLQIMHSEGVGMHLFRVPSSFTCDYNAQIFFTESIFAQIVPFFMGHLTIFFTEIITLTIIQPKLLDQPRLSFG